MVQVSWTVRNEGTDSPDASEWFDNFYLSNDQTLDSSDVYTGFQRVTTADFSGDTYTFNTQIEVGNIGAGSKYLLLVVNDGSLQSETDSTNNVASAAISLIEQNVNLEPVGATVTGQEASPLPVLSPNSTFVLNWSVNNTGTAPSHASRFDDIYLSDDPVFDASDTLLDTEYTNEYIIPGITATYSRELTIGSETGPKYLIIVVDAGNNQSETDDDNAPIVLPIMVGEVNIDLTPADISVDQDTVQAGNGNQINVTWTVQNTGQGAATGNWVNEFYLSNDDVLDDSDRLTDSKTINGSIAAGDSATFNESVMINSFSPGAAYLLVRVNAGGLVAETDTTNNVIAIPLTLTVPDTNLFVSDTRVSGEGLLGTVGGEVTSYLVASGGTIHLEWDTYNDGTDDALAPRVDRVYLSTPGMTNAVLIGSVSTDQTTPSNGFTTNSLDITLGDIFGTANLFIIIDADDNQYETVPYDNVGYVYLNVTSLGSDLVISDVTAPSEAMIGDELTVQWTSKNIGTADAIGNWYDYVYLTQDPNNVGFGYVVHPRTELDAGQSSELTSRTFTIPDVEPGTWYIVVRADGQSTLQESDETNNDFVLPIQLIRPDRNLTLKDVNAPSTIVQGDTFNVSWTVESTGTTPVDGLWFDRVYLSTDDTLDSNDLLIGTLDRGSTDPLNQGDSYSLSQNLLLTNRPNGNYYLFVSVDRFGSIGETDTSDNIVRLPVLVTGADLAVTNVQAPDSVVLGQTFDVTYTVQNIGTATATRDWGDQVSLVNSLGVSVLTIVVNSADISPLEPGASYTKTATFTVPFNLPTGAYTLRIVPNSGGLQAESTRLNNTSIQNIIINPVPLPDLVVTSLSAPVEGVSGQGFYLTWVVTNSGTGTATGTWHDQVWARDASSNFPVTFPYDFAFAGTLAPGESVTRTQLFNFPNLSGNIRWEVTTDATGLINEGSEGETNNLTVASNVTVVTPAPPPPDLVVSTLVQPGGLIYSGEDLSVTFTVTNQGGSSTNVPSWSDYVFLSQDPSLIYDTLPGGNDDRFINLNPYRPIAFDSVTSLAPGDSYSQSVNIPIPLDASGTWYLYVMANGIGGHFPPPTLTESDRGNNLTRSDGFQIQLSPTPNLVTNPVTVAGTAFSGQPLVVDWKVTNVGEGATPAETWLDRIYLSTDNVLDSSDIALTSVNATRDFEFDGPLAAGQAYLRSINVKLPDGIEGDYYIIVAADAFKNVYEQGFESDNIAASLPVHIFLTPPPDLEVSSVTSPDTALSSHPISVTYVVQNNGSTSTSNATLTDRFYLSTDAALDGGDIQIGESVYTRAALAPTGSYSRTVSLTLPNGIEGTYYLIVQNDATDQVFEVDNLNNIASRSMTIQNLPADLVVTSLTAPPTASTADPIILHWTVQNTGVGSTGPSQWIDKVYLSLDGTTTNTILLGKFTHSGRLEAGAVYSQSAIVTVPYGVQGPLHLFVVTDAPLTVAEDGTGVTETGPGGQVYEGGAENNNTSSLVSLAVTLKSPDLQLIGSTIPTSALSADLLNLSWNVQNAGSVVTNSSFWFDDIYLSTDDQLDGNDVLLGSTLENGSLAPGDSRSMNATVRLPQTLTAGTYYILIALDRPLPTTLLGLDTNLVSEGGGEANNVTAFALSVSLHDVPNLVTSSVTNPSSAISGRSFDVGWTVTNNGPAAADGSWYDSVYLSADQIFDTTDLSLGTVKHQGGLASGNSYSVNNSFNLPAGLSGSFYVFVVTDSGKVVYERGMEDDNTAFQSTSTEISLTAPVDLTVGNIVLPSSGTSGLPLTIQYDVTNSSTSTAYAGWEDIIYLSSDNTWSLDDIIIGKVTHTSDLLAGQSAAQSATFDLPIVLPGSYQVIIRTDVRNIVVETDETNNVGTSSAALPVSAEELFVGEDKPITLSTSESRLFQFTATPGQAVRISVDGVSSDSGVDLYISHGQVPTRPISDFRTSSIAGDEASIVIPRTESGIYYILVYGADIAGATLSATVMAETLPFEVTSVSQTTAAPLGPVTLEINGALFDRSTVFELVGPSGQILQSTYQQFESASVGFATFDLTGKALGAYTLRATKGDEVSELANAVTVSSGIVGQLAVAIDGPDTYFPNRPGSLNVTYKNIGDTDLVAPLLTISATDNAMLGYTPDNLSFGKVIQIVATSPDGPAGILRPGESVTIQVYFRSPADVNALATYKVASINATDSRPIDDDILDYRSRPVNITDAVWQPIFEVLKQQIGTTWGDYVKTVAHYATLLPPELGYAVSQSFDLAIATNVAQATIHTSLRGKVSADSLAVDISGRLLTAIDLASGNTFLTTTLNDGSFIFSDIAPGTYRFTLDGAVIAEDFQVTVGDGDHVQGITVPADAGGTVQGHVLTESNAPITSGSVSLYDLDANLLYTGTIASNGTYTFEGLLPGTYTLEVDSPGRAQSIAGPIIVSGTEVVLHDVVMQAASSITAHAVLPGGYVLSDNITITATPHDPTNLLGFYSDDSSTPYLHLSDLPAGDYDVTIELAGFLTVTINNVTLSQADNLDLGEVNLIPAARIQGTVQFNDPLTATNPPTVRLLLNGTPVAYTTANVTTGAFSFNQLAAGNYVVEVMPIVGEGTSQAVTIVAGQVVDDVLLQTLPGSSITGTVTDTTTDAPLVGATVVIYGPTGASINLTTNALGQYRLSRLELGTYTVALPTGGAASRQVVDITDLNDQEYVANLEFDSVARLSGQLLDSVGNPISQGIVELLLGGQPVSQATVDSNGNYAFYLTSPGIFQLQAFSNNGSFAAKDITISGDDDQTANLIAGGASVEITVTNPVGSVDSAYVRLQRFVGGSYQDVALALADSDGHASFSNLLAGDYRINVRTTDGRGATAITTLVDSQVTAISLPAEDRASLTGMVTSAGQPVKIAEVSLYNSTTGQWAWTTFTNSQGQYSIAGLQAGTYDLVVRASSYRSYVVEGMTISTTATADVTLTASTSQIQGTLTDGSGTPIPAGTILVLDAENRVVGRASTNSEGGFSITTVFGSGYHLQTLAEGYQSITVDNISVGDGDTLDLGTLSAQAVAISATDVATTLNSGFSLLSVGGGGSNSFGSLAMSASFSATSSDNGNSTNGTGTSGGAEGYEDLLALIDTDVQTGNVDVNKELLYINSLETRIFQDYQPVTEMDRITDPGSPPECPECMGAYNALKTAIKEQEKVFKDFYKALESLNNLQDLAIPMFIGEIDSQFVVPFLVPFAKYGQVFGFIAGIGINLVNLKNFEDDIVRTQTAKSFAAKAGSIGSILTGALTNAGQFLNFMFGEPPPGIVNNLAFLPQSFPKYVTALGLIGNAIDFFASNANGEILEGSIDVANKIDVTENLVKTLSDSFKEKVKITFKALEKYQQCLKDADCEDDDAGEPNHDPPPPDPPNDKHDMHTGKPNDPNDILGPQGFGDEHWVGAASKSNSLSYLIRFENKPEATASVHEASITEMLDSDIDPRTFRFGDITIGGKTFSVPANAAFLDMRLDLLQERGIYVDVLANVDVRTGEVFWLFGAIDPETGLTPLDSRVGFLPPNDDSGIGEATVSYTANPKSSTVTGTVVSAQATIVFDSEPPLDTPVWSNRLDKSAPTSHVDALPSITGDSEFLVSWSAADLDGTGVGGVTVYVSENGGPFEIWLANTQLTSAIFQANPETTYAFYTVAVDRSGNMESPPIAPDAVVRTTPTIEVSGPAEAVLYQEVSFAVTVVNQRADAGAQKYIFVDWDNDGNADQFFSIEEGTVSHVFNTSGEHSFTFLLLDHDGNTIAQMTSSIRILASTTQTNEENPSLTDLIYSGTAEADHFVVEELDPTTIQITSLNPNGDTISSQTYFGITGIIRIYGGGGDDLIDASSVV
ncbi:carboxypeptidase regulatory-like domain-containing protein, partial [bacterium]|nr:carboxypeptidase regulatory-like domain-containing protein [bacterium]